MNQSIVFDMDGVIFDSQIIYDNSFKTVGKDFGLSPAVLEKFVVDVAGLNEQDCIRTMHRYFGDEFPAGEMLRRMKEEFEKTVRKEGLVQKPGIRQLLDWLSKQGFVIGLASSTKKKMVLDFLERAGLVNYFDYIIGGDYVKNCKPAPDIYLMACDGMHVDPRETFAVEDSFNGVRSAAAASMKVVMVPDRMQPTAEIEELLFDKYDTLLDFLACLQGSVCR